MAEIGRINNLNAKGAMLGNYSCPNLSNWDPVSHYLMLSCLHSPEHSNPQSPVWWENIRSITRFWYLNPLTFVEECLISTLNRTPPHRTNMSSPSQLRLPDLLAQWPWPRKLNQHYQEAKTESDKWLRGFEVLDAKSQRSFDLCDFRQYSFRCLSSI